MSQIQEDNSEWEYGKITLHTQFNLPSDAILITTLPFSQRTTSHTLLINTDNEDMKCMQNVDKILAFFVEKRVNRSSTIYVKGGGMLLDMCGFACSIYMRGIKKMIFIPTTVLAIADAAIGGKNGINFSNAKNLIGTLKHPSQVIIDISALKSLNDRQFYNGFAEIIKMAVTYDKPFFQYLLKTDLSKIRSKQNEGQLMQILLKSIKLKQNVVSIDQFQQNQRKWLNVGHTIGHAIELSSYNLLHGQCVSIGMLLEVKLSIELQLIPHQQGMQLYNRLRKLLKNANLPTQLKQPLKIKQVMTAMQKDKKATSTKNIDFALLSSIGERCQSISSIPTEKVQLFLAESVRVRWTTEVSPTINSQFPFPSSKSISLRLAYIGALASFKYNQEITISNFLSSQDTACMLDCLSALGFRIKHNQKQKTLRIRSIQNTTSNGQQRQLNVGNSGITARFILPLCCYLPGKWKINCQARMSDRPNKQIIDLCINNFKDVQFSFIKKPFAFPLEINSQSNMNSPHFPFPFPSQITVSGQLSSQYISSIMLFNAFLNNKPIKILIKQQANHLVSESYLHMTSKCLSFFNINVNFSQAAGIHTISIDNTHIHCTTTLTVQTDLSTLSYPYVFAHLHNIATPVLGYDYMQGDTLFYSYVEQIRTNKDLKHMKMDFNNCTDTFMSMAVLLLGDYVQKSPLQTVEIFNIANQRVKQSNRIHLIIYNLKLVGMQIEQYPNSIILHVKPPPPTNYNTIIFRTDGDHRLAMALGVLSTYLSKVYPSCTFIIDKKRAVDKTFPQFWKYLQQAGISISGYSPTDMQIYHKPTPIHSQSPLVLIGNRGSGKTTIGKGLALGFNYAFVDLDDIITQKIQSQYRLHSIEQFVAKYDWNAFRELQSVALQQTIRMRNSASKPLIISTGGGIIQTQINQSFISRQSNVIYLQRNVEELRIQLGKHRPQIGNFNDVFAKRSPIYQSLASAIISIPNLSFPSQLSYVKQCIQMQQMQTHRQLQPGFILCHQLGQTSIQSILGDIQQPLSAVQLRLDYAISSGTSMKQIRRQIALFKLKNKMHTILTLRSKDQFGLFDGNYLNAIDQIRKIPSEFMDHQVKYTFNFIIRYPIRYPYDFRKLILSYHGRDMGLIKKLCNPEFVGLPKLCFQGERTDTAAFQQVKRMLPGRRICINLSDQWSRLDNQFKMVIGKQPANPSPTGILTIPQMKAMQALRKLLKR